MRHIFHEFMVMLEVKLSAKLQTSAIFARLWYPISDLLKQRSD